MSRACEHCGASIDHKRSNARFCDRKCKGVLNERARRADPARAEALRIKDRARYEREKTRRKQQAVAYYWSHQERYIEASRVWRSENPHRRRQQGEVRADRMREGDFVPFGKAEWEKLKRRFEYRCAYCGERKPLTRDHVVPLSRGGRHAIANILPACRSCNSSKNASLLVEWRLRQQRGG